MPSRPAIRPGPGNWLDNWFDHWSDHVAQIQAIGSESSGPDAQGHRREWPRRGKR